MPLDFRYHLASLTAVFGALLIGILLGVALMDRNGLSKQFKQLHQEFHDSQVLRDIDQQTDLFNERTQQKLVGGLLANRNVALIENAFVFPDNKVDDVRRVLDRAGATITVEITLKPGLMQATPEQVQAICRQLQITSDKPEDISDLLYRLGKDLGNGSTALADALQHKKLIHFSGDITKPISTVVYLGGGIDSPEDSLNSVDLPFLRACVERELHVAATEPFEAKRSMAAEYQKVVPITIDNIDRAAGRTALILALAGNRQGHFGYKPNADDVVPDTE